MAQAVVLAREDQAKLEQIERAAPGERAALRARIVLRAAHGLGINQTSTSAASPTIRFASGEGGS